MIATRAGGSQGSRGPGRGGRTGGGAEARPGGGRREEDKEDIILQKFGEFPPGIGGLPARPRPPASCSSSLRS